MAILLFFVFGTIVGSFLNVVILRMHTGRTVGGRSACMSCGNTLKWYELAPIISFIFLKGRCRKCQSAISIQYPLVEFIAGALFAIFAYKEFFLSGEFSLVTTTLFFIKCLIWSVLLVIVVYDLRHMIIPNTASFLFALLALLLLAIRIWQSDNFRFEVSSSVLGALALFLFLYALWAISNGRWIGLGDAKLAVGIGIYLGLAQGVSALAFSFWIGAVVALSILAGERLKDNFGLRKGIKSLTMKTEVPFAPFLITGMFVAEMLGSDIFHIANLLS
jgi:prepilin signal peptidase PulO-like enzyme (type II secretory pathway)